MRHRTNLLCLKDLFYRNISLYTCMHECVSSPCPDAGQTEWSLDPTWGTRSQLSDTSEWHRCCRGSECDKWLSFSGPWWTILGQSWQPPAKHVACDPPSDSAPGTHSREEEEGSKQDIWDNWTSEVIYTIRTERATWETWILADCSLVSSLTQTHGNVQYPINV